jgi:hypothetical protein
MRFGISNVINQSSQSYIISSNVVLARGSREIVAWVLLVNAYCELMEISHCDKSRIRGAEMSVKMSKFDVIFRCFA